LITDIGPGIQAYLIQQGVSNKFTVHIVMAPNFTYVEDEVERCEDVFLALGLYIYSGGVWTRETYPYPNGLGHCVTVAGINSTTLQISISDPYNDNAEPAPHGNNGLGQVLPLGVDHNIQQILQTTFITTPALSPTTYTPS
jgi:hypothetical protein